MFHMLLQSSKCYKKDRRRDFSFPIMGHSTTGSGALAPMSLPVLILVKCWRMSWIRLLTLTEFAGLPYCSVKLSLWLTKVCVLC